MKTGPKAKNPIDRFMKFIERSDNGCWEWTGSIMKNGYGRFTVGSRTDDTLGSVLAHRWIYEYRVGKIKDGMTIDHLCKNRSCVNTEHMEIVSRGENSLRGNSPYAINKRKTHCKHGHPFDESNTHYNSNGDRSCRTCDREYHASEPYLQKARIRDRKRRQDPISKELRRQYDIDRYNRQKPSRNS